MNYYDAKSELLKKRVPKVNFTHIALEMTLLVGLASLIGQFSW